MSIYKPEQKYVDLFNQWKRIDHFIIKNQEIFCNTVSNSKISYEVLNPKTLISGAVDFTIWINRDSGDSSLPILITKDMNYCSSYIEYYHDLPSIGYSSKHTNLKFIDANKNETFYDLSTIHFWNLESKTEEELFQLSTIYSEKEFIRLWMMYKICTEFDGDYFHSFTGDLEQLDMIDEDLMKIAISWGVPYA